MWICGSDYYPTGLSALRLSSGGGGGVCSHSNNNGSANECTEFHSRSVFYSPFVDRDFWPWSSRKSTECCSFVDYQRRSSLPDTRLTQVCATLFASHFLLLNDNEWTILGTLRKVTIRRTKHMLGPVQLGVYLGQEMVERGA